MLSLDTSVTKEAKMHVFSIAIKKAKEFENFESPHFLECFGCYQCDKRSRRNLVDDIWKLECFLFF